VKKRVLVLGAGFGGLELCTILSESLGSSIETTLIDRSDCFVFGSSKLDVMFRRATPKEVRLPYRSFVKPGVRFVQRIVTGIDPVARRVTTDDGVFEADFIVLALGAEYDIAATPGLAEAGHEFYTIAGAERVREAIPDFRRGRAVVGVCGLPFKCPPAPSEAALLLHDDLVERGVRDDCEIVIVVPAETPVPPSPDTSQALLTEFAEHDVRFLPNRRVSSLDPARRTAVLDDGSELPFDLFMGVPKHRVPGVVEKSGLTENGWVAVNPRTLETRHAGVFAIGDVANMGTPKAGSFAEGAARAVASSLIAALGGGGEAEAYAGTGACYLEFGRGRVGRVDIDLFSGPSPTGRFQQPTAVLRGEKAHYGSSRRARWFGT
jgi:sulfide:quinone oxidoreductase